MYSNQLDIFKYDNFRLYLRDSVSYLRENGSSFSYRKFSGHAGFSSPNFLILLMKGERNLSQDSAYKVAQAFELINDQKDYFVTLVRFNQAKDSAEKFKAAQSLLKIKTKLNLCFLSDKQFEYYSSWINIAVRELLIIYPKLETQGIFEKLVPQPSIYEIDKSLQLLQDLGLIERTGEEWSVKDTSLSTGNQFVSSSVVEFHKNIIELGKQSLGRFSKSDRDITATTVGLSKENFEIIRKKIQDLRLDIISLSESDMQKENVFQFNFQCFPISKNEER